MTFMTIDNVAEMQEQLEHKPEIAFNLRNGVTTCSYIISMENTFDSKHAIEARGIVFGTDGSVISRPLHKFFNVNERAETQAHLIPWNRITRVMNKRDGSMIHSVKLDGGVKPLCDGAKFALKTKKSFESDVVLSVNDWLRKSAPADIDYVGLCNECAERNLTAIFEYTAPTNRIVVYYDEPSLKLLHVRENRSGKYLSKSELLELCVPFNVEVVEDDPFVMGLLKVDPTLLFDHAQVLTGVEGWVLQFDNGDMVKLKTKWYMDLHNSMTFLRERDIAELVVNEQIDDLKAKLVSEGVDISEIIEVENRVISEINRIKQAVEQTTQEAVELFGQDKKLIVQKYLTEENFKYFKLMAYKLVGKEPDYVKYFAQKELNEKFGLRQLNLGSTAHVTTAKN